MKNKNFEMKLSEMSKPEINQLKHQDMLAKAIINAKDSSVVSLWWLSIPLFIVAMLMMKSYFMPGSSLVSNIKDLALREKYIYHTFFLIAPVALILFNGIIIKRVHFLSGSPRSMDFLKDVWYNVVIIALSAVILIIYIL